MFAALTLFFRGLKTLPLAEGIAVAFSAPLFVTALSWPMLGERVGPYRWAAVVIGFFGALVVLRPGTDAFRPEALFIVASAVFFALAMLHTRRISRTETNVAMYTYSTIIGRPEHGAIAAVRPGSSLSPCTSGCSWPWA